MSVAPSRLKISLALSTSLPSSAWTEMSMLPLRILPSYCLASYSGIPRPTSAPVIPPAGAPTAAPPSRRPHDGTGSDERADAGNRERADSNQPAQPAAQHAARSRSGRSAFGCLRVLLMGEVASARLVRKQHRNVVPGESCRFELIRDPLNLRLARRNAEH